MASYSKFLQLANGVARQVDLSANTLVVQYLQAGSGSSTLTQGVASGGSGYTILWPNSQGGANTYLQNDGSGNLSWASAGSGSVTSVSVVSTNGFAGTVANPTTTPAITIETTINAAILAGTGTALQAASLPQNEIYVGNSSNLPVAVAMSGDATIASSGALTLATVNSDTGSFGSSTAIPTVTVNGKGLITAITTNAVVAPAGTLTGTTLASNVVNSSLTSLGTQVQALNMGGYQINDLGAPSASSDAATKGYVDAAINGLTWKGPVQAYANSNIALTGGATLTIDGYSVQNGDYVILGNQTTASQNYVYVASGIGTAYTLTEVTGSEAPTAIGDAYLVEQGTQYGNSAFQVNAISPNVTFIQFAGPNFLSFTSPLSLSGNTVSLDYSNGLTLSGSALVVQASNSSITVGSGGISVNLSGSGAILNSSGLYINLNATNPGLAITSNALDVKYNPAGAIVASSSGIASQVLSTGGIQISSNSLAIKLASNSALATGSSGLTTQSDGSTIGVNGSNQLYVPNAGITDVQINTDVFDQKTITGGNGSAAAVAYAPAIEFTGVAGQTFSANTTYALRYGLPQNSETAGRLYAADITTSSYDLFWVVGFLPAGTGYTAGNSMTVIKFGPMTLGSSDTNFGSNDPGKPCYLQSGGINATTTAPSTSGQAVAKLGIVTSTTTFLADIGTPAVY